MNMPLSKPVFTEEMKEAAIDALQNEFFVVGESVYKFEGEFARYIGTKHAVAVNSGIFALASDLNSGFRALKKSVATEFMHILPNTFSFSTTITLACIMSRYNVKYVPIEAPERVGTSKIKPFRDGFRYCLSIL